MRETPEMKERESNESETPEMKEGERERYEEKIGKGRGCSAFRQWSVVCGWEVLALSYAFNWGQPLPAHHTAWT